MVGRGRKRRGMANSGEFNWRQFLAGLIGVLLVLAVIGLIVLLIVRAMAALDSEVAIAVLGAGGTITVSVISLTIGRYLERKRQIEADTRLKKIPLYEDFISFWFRVLYQDQLGKPVTQKELLKFFVDFTKVATVWASDDVIRKWRQTRQEFEGIHGEAPPRSLFMFEELLLAIRRDAGYPSTQLRRGELLGLWVTDIDRFLES
jgi:hypothetical protein